MANKSLFQSTVGALLPAANALNEERAPAYAFSPKHALAQYAVTGCLNGTFYATAKEQLDRVVALCGAVEPEFVAKTAVYARERGFMKDLPALLCSTLSVLSPELLVAAFPRVISSGKMLRTFVQILRSGQVARRSLGSLPKRLVREWLERQSDEALFRDSVGQSPSIADVVKMVHPRPRTKSREALYGYFLRREHDAEALPPLVRELEAFKANPTRAVPEVPFQMLTTFDLGASGWASIARTASWQTTRMNLNTFARHGVFESRRLTSLVAERLADREQVRRARAFPYQLLTAFQATGEDVPASVREALHDAMEHALANVPAIDGRVFVCPDVSGSMSSPITGVRQGATTKTRCIDVAALVAAAVLRQNPRAEVLPFEHAVVDLRLDARDSVMTNARKLASVGGGGTNCSAPLALLNSRKAKGDVVIFVSDNESWVDAHAGRGTATLAEWERFRARNPNARLVCIDLQPYGTTQAAEREDVLNVGGFSDLVFELVARHAAGELSADHWVGEIEKVQLH